MNKTLAFPQQDRLQSIKPVPFGMKFLKTFIKLLPRGRMPLMHKVCIYFPKGLHKGKWNGIDMIFDFRDRDSWLLYFNNITERYLTPYFVASLKEETVFLDIGANNGYFSLLAANLTKQLNAYAFEANPKLVALLNEIIRMNALSKKVEVISGAVSSKSGELMFDFTNINHQGTGHIVNKNGEGFTKVPAFTIDEWGRQNNLEHIDIVKIDVEGAEMDVLRGMEQYINRRAIDLFFIEVHANELPTFGTKPSELFDFLANNHYQLFVLPSEFTVLPGNRYNPTIADIPLYPLSVLEHRRDSWWHCIALSPNGIKKHKTWLQLPSN